MGKVTSRAKPLEPLTFLVLSDIHFGKFAVAEEFQPTPNAGGKFSPKTHSTGLIEKVLELSEKPNVLLVPGDLTSIASPSEFSGCVETILDIASRLNISQDHVYCTFGNHDVDWRICSLASESPPYGSDARYNDIAAQIGSLFCPIQSYTESGPLPGCGVFQTDNFTLYVANSGYYSIKTQEIRNGRLGEKQLNWLRDALKRYESTSRWQVLMLHHHPFNYTYPTPIGDVSCVEEGAELVELAGGFGIDFICHGHRHHPRLFTEFRTGWKRPVTFFCAGSFGVNAEHRDSGRIPNLFHVVSLGKRLSTGSAYGNITSFELASDGWRPITDCPETPLDHIHWFGALTTIADRQTAVRKFIVSETKGTESQHIFLPKHNVLPPEIKCCGLHELNSLLIGEAPQQGFRVVGKYPDDVALIRE